jgi:hypothetical protein
MKYKAIQLIDKSYAVGYGKRYYPDTKTANKKEAEVNALMMSARWYQDKMSECHQVLNEKYPDHIDPVDPLGYLA